METGCTKPSPCGFAVSMAGCPLPTTGAKCLNTGAPQPGTLLVPTTDEQGPVAPPATQSTGKGLHVQSHLQGVTQIGDSYEDRT